MARPKNQSARREQLTRATEQALRHRGPQELRYRDVADAAGLTAPAVSYYFSELEALITETYARVTMRYLERRRQLIDAVQEPSTKLATLIECGVPSGPDDHDALLTYQMAGNPTVADAYGALAAELFNGEVALYTGVIKLCTPPPGHAPLASALIARCLVSMEDSLGLRVVSQDAGYERTTAVDNIRAVASVLTGVELPEVPAIEQLLTGASPHPTQD